MTTPRPIPIPRDLKKGDIIVDNRGIRHVCGGVQSSIELYNGRQNGHLFLWTQSPDIDLKNWLCEGPMNGRTTHKEDGIFAVRIERIASKARKAKVDKDAEWLIGQTVPQADQKRRFTFSPEATAGQWNRRLRAIARRLNGGGK